MAACRCYSSYIMLCQIPQKIPISPKFRIVSLSMLTMEPKLWMKFTLLICRLCYYLICVRHSVNVLIFPNIILFSITLQHLFRFGLKAFTNFSHILNLQNMRVKGLNNISSFKKDAFFQHKGKIHEQVELPKIGRLEKSACIA